jgi:hypothetical protein
MKVGTKSILFGAHQFVVHPWFVAWAWWKLYGFPWDPRLWVAFFVHDLGYIGKPNMDGVEGESHVELGARVMYWLFDWPWRRRRANVFGEHNIERGQFGAADQTDWAYWRNLCLYHSRFRAMRDGQPFSRLCVADKLAIALTPAWLYLPMATASGEIHEYMALAKKRTEAGEPKYASMNVYSDDRRQWYADVQEYLRRWVETHRDGREDTWTPKADLIGTCKARTDSGVWQ